MKIKSKEHFLDVIQAERAWRRKELSNMKSLIHQSRDAHQDMLVRAGILLLYSHWEGFVKKGCEAFFTYLNFKAYKYSDLQPNFLAVGLIEQYNGHFPPKKVSAYFSAVDSILNSFHGQKFKIDVQVRVDTKSNLTRDVLVDLLNMVGLDPTHFENHQGDIDHKLVKYRNAIAHGERTEYNPELYIDSTQFNDLFDRIDALINHFENMIINYVELESYKITSD
ncbi:MULTISPECIES: MAE_28990/MAE_18760 family HEPN-like nuclease [Vibrio harveyi group]|uniref:MAE_28990/MAE_18760 family HEPN-like nuclease n=1 Tax=Vibrio harveyi group TaxID=717610 RepID=UPI00063EACF1|nr:MULTISPECIES: MAE_28990/MAE_18760 family HEPN-like nuclease [Vibrio harveyi group]EJB8454947.1 hypothetical protein [Vibrio parahaemolyticus]KLI82971.1 hypothetical protein AAY62_21840 [Vibrio parahaemolyticus]MCC8256626.1 hypothetical protein [Vibrio campbellii CAIM 333]MDG2637898.1 MAE_28990/MAE_18760 family HEPN-like nuclease [Vibrio parahaemolyticus]